MSPSKNPAGGGQKAKNLSDMHHKGHTMATTCQWMGARKIPGQALRVQPSRWHLYGSSNTNVNKRKGSTSYNVHCHLDFQEKECEERFNRLDKIDDLENKSRRNNLVFFKLPEVGAGISYHSCHGKGYWKCYCSYLRHDSNYFITITMNKFKEIHRYSDLNPNVIWDAFKCYIAGHCMLHTCRPHFELGSTFVCVHVFCVVL